VSNFWENYARKFSVRNLIKVRKFFLVEKSLINFILFFRENFAFFMKQQV